MTKIIQLIDVDSEGHKVRLDDGRVVRMPHGADHPHVGEEFAEPTEPAMPAIDPAVELAQLKAHLAEHNDKMASIQQVKRPETAQEAMLALADWLDSIYGDAVTGEDVVQQDLRRFAASIGTLEEQLAQERAYIVELEAENKMLSGPTITL